MPTKLYADEHVPLAVIRGLRRDGHDVVRAIEAAAEGTGDQAHFERAISSGRILLTQDADFLALSSGLLEQGGHHPGVVYWPQGAYSIGRVIRRLKQHLETTTPEVRRDLIKFL